MVISERRTVAGPHGPIPLLVLEPPSARATVLVYHGLQATKETQCRELESLSAAGFRAVGVDAVGHGERAAPPPDEEDPHVWFLRLVIPTMEEVPTLVDAFPGPVGLVGISMGGYVAFAAAVEEPRLGAVVPILGSPDWTRRTSPGPRIPGPMAARSPHRRSEKIRRVPLFAWNAGLDVNVPPEAARVLMEGMQGERHAYVEYPESDHFMREEDWNDGWRRTVEWMERWL